MRDTEWSPQQLYGVLARFLWLAVGVFLLIWFLDLITTAILFFAFALILMMALNPPVTWLEGKGVPRGVAALLVFLSLLAAFALLAWLLVPTLIEQVTQLVRSLPDYAASLRSRADRWLTRTPGVEDWLQLDNLDTGKLLPAAQTVLLRVGRYSLGLVTLVLFAIVLASTVVYALANPRPLLHGYLSVFPPQMRERAARAFARSSEVVVGWLWSNVIVGSIEGIAAAAFLYWMGVPGALLWGVLTFFAELVPKLGPYLMTLPPVLIALAIDPMTAVWVLLFYIVLQEIAGDVIAPLVRARQMNLHPVSTIFAVLAMGSAFGLLGALISTPVAGFVKAYYDEFYAARNPRDEKADERVEDMLHRRVVQIERDEADEADEAADSDDATEPPDAEERWPVRDRAAA